MRDVAAVFGRLGFGHLRDVFINQTSDQTTNIQNTHKIGEYLGLTPYDCNLRTGPVRGQGRDTLTLLPRLEIH